MSFNAQPITFTYDALGRRKTMADASGTTTYNYDPQTGRLTSKQTPEGTLSYGYDAAGNLLSVEVVTEFGTKFVVQMEIIGPNGAKGLVEVVWQLDQGSKIYRLITAIPKPY